MNLVLKLAALLFVVPATYFFVYWVPFSLVPLGEERWIAGVMSLLIAGVAGWFVWTKLASAQDGAISSILTGAVLVGGIGFTAGFFGPIMFTPEANQGPLLGIFITGPLGFLLGGIGGLLYWLIGARKRPSR